MQISLSCIEGSNSTESYNAAVDMIDFHCDSRREWMGRNHNFLLAQAYAISNDVDDWLPLPCLFKHPKSVYIVLDNKCLGIVRFI